MNSAWPLKILAYAAFGLFWAMVVASSAWATSWRYIGPEDAPKTIRIAAPCVDNGLTLCLTIEPRVPKGMGPTLVPLITKVLTAWSNPLLKFSLLPAIELESQFDAELAENLNGFSISFVAPDADFVSQAEPFRLLEKADTLSGHTIAARIYLSMPPEANEQEHVAAYALGRLLGLGSSIEDYSLMTENWKIPLMKSISNLDLLWLSSLYASDPGRGKLRGFIKDGETKKPLRGVTVMALRAEKVEAFIAQQERSLIDRITYSGPDGSFILPEMDLASYYILVESRGNNPLSVGRFDSWLRHDDDKKFFEMEFYDGAERESNAELTYSFSPEALGYAALVPVTAGADISGITLITNLVKPAEKSVVTEAAPGEQLAGSFPQEKNLEAKRFEALPKSSGGGCEISRSSGNDETKAGIAALFFILIFLMRFRVQRLKSTKS